MEEFVKNLGSINNIYFDSKKIHDCTIKVDDILRKTKQNIYVLVFGKEGKFLSSVVSMGEGAIAGAEAIKSVFYNKRISWSNILLMGCDGTNSNTGRKGGIIRLLEVDQTKFN